MWGRFKGEGGLSNAGESIGNLGYDQIGKYREKTESGRARKKDVSASGERKDDPLRGGKKVPAAVHNASQT